MDPSSGNSPIPGIRSSPLYSMLRPLSLEELGKLFQLKDKGSFN